MEELLEEIARLRRLTEQQQKQIEALQAQVVGLTEALEEARKAAARSAAPFRRPSSKRRKRPKKPGRKKGHPGESREPPRTVTETIVVPLARCPHCGDELTDVRPIEQLIEDFEVVLRVLRLVTHRGTCAGCGTVRSTHPRQQSRASGAAANQLGPRSLAMALDLNKRLGLPLRKTCDVMQTHLGITMSPGGLFQAQARLAQRLQPAYEQVVERVRGSPSVNVDETGWWVGEPNWWLWVFVTDDDVLYHVDERRNREVLDEILGDYQGVLGSDCLAAYESMPCRQQKCYAHHLKAIRLAKDTRPDDPDGFLEEMTSLLREALLIGRVRDDIGPERLNRAIGSLEHRAHQWLSRSYEQPALQRVRNRLWKRREHLFTFLRETRVDATNNAAERALRPAVIARKLSCGNRTDRGRRTFQTLMTLATNAHRRGESFRDLIESAVRLPA